MAKALDIDERSRWQKCPDCCGTEWVTLFEGIVGDGKCSHCRGTGFEPDPLQTIVSTIGGPTMECQVCSGTEQCQTCGGEGRVLKKVIEANDREDEASTTSHLSEDHDDSYDYTTYDDNSESYASEKAKGGSERVAGGTGSVAGVLIGVLLTIIVLFVVAVNWDSIVIALEDLAKGVFIAVIGVIILLALASGK